MGVLGLTPFLQKTCPEVIKHLPERFRGLAGKTLVIDGTLITQRFYYAQDPHPFRHVLGWYRLIKELETSNVSAICVFDGKERNIAKAREAERRREVQRKTNARGILEQERAKRLRKLSATLQALNSLERKPKDQVNSIIQNMWPQPPNPQINDLQASIAQQMQKSPDMPRTVELSSPYVPTTHDGDTPPEFDVANNGVESFPDDTQRSSDLQDPWLDSKADALRSLPDPDEHLRDVSEVDQSWENHRDDLPLEDTVSVSAYYLEEAFSQSETTVIQPDGEAPTVLSSGDQLATALRDLYLHYQRSITLLSSIATPQKLPLSATPPSPDPDVQADIVATKTQYQLSIEEGKVWGELLSATPTAVPQSSTDALARLSRTSEAMCDSFNRRMNTPVAQTYQECKEILEAMGVPCLEPPGAFEGEAFASSIVKHGLADYVASEDTDVLVYEAPLVRNLTNRQLPLMIISGADIRDVLQLDRSSFIDFVLLLGTDFSQRIKNVGPARALKFIREYGSIERVIDVEIKYPPRIPNEAYLQQVDMARTVFQTLPPAPDEGMISPGVLNQDKVAEILQRHGLGRALTEFYSWDYTEALEGNYFADNPRAE